MQLPSWICLHRLCKTHIANLCMHKSTTDISVHNNWEKLRLWYGLCNLGLGLTFFTVFFTSFSPPAMECYYFVTLWRQNTPHGLNNEVLNFCLRMAPVLKMCYFAHMWQKIEQNHHLPQLMLLPWRERKRTKHQWDKIGCSRIRKWSL